MARKGDDPTQLPVWGVAEVADVLGWQSGRVSVYARRGQLPPPIGHLAATPIWAPAAIMGYAEEQGITTTVEWTSEGPVPIVETCALALDDDPLEKEIRQVVREIEQERAAAIRLGEGLKELTPHLSGDAADAAAETATASTDLVASGRDARAIKRRVAGIRNEVRRLHHGVAVKQKRLRDLIERRQKKLQDVLEERRRDLKQRLDAQRAEMAGIQSDMEAIVKGLNSMVARAEEAIWTLNLYLGTNVQLVRLRRGEPAPPEVRICIRQLVLFMDEEIALAGDHAERGGIDWEDLETFDRWLLADSAHLDQVLPEAKGVVALTVRRKAKDYGTRDREREAELNAKNFKTYFLMRSGENLYRIWTDLDLATRLFPRADELDEVFYRKRYDHKRDAYVTEPLKPGSREYMTAMKAADATTRHYLRVLLFLQGLLDRTPVFQPLPAPRINVCLREDQERYLRFIHDAEALLTTGRPVFSEWLRATNENLRLGVRIIGSFHRWDLLHGEDRDARLSPSKWVQGLESLQVYTLEHEIRPGEYRIYFERTDQVWRRGYWRSGYAPAERRGSFRVKAKDNFILAFDFVTLEDIEYYLQDRLSRHDYWSLVPLLKTARELKLREREDEAPFRDLLVGQIAQQHRVSIEAAGVEVEALVRWWKRKTKTHRALLSDDNKALRMIVAEWERRRRRREVRRVLAGDQEEIVGSILKQEPDTILIAHTSGDRLVVYVPENEEDIFVREGVWRYGVRAGLRRDGEKRWQVVDRRHKDWKTLFAQPRWETWNRDARRSDILTDPERDALVDESWGRVREAEQERQRGYRPQAPREIFPMAVTVEGAVKLRLYYRTSESVEIPEQILSGRSPEAHIEEREILWRRRRRGVDGRLSWARERRSHPERLPWGKQEKVLWLDEKQLEASRADHQTVEAAEAKRRRLRQERDRACAQAREAMAKEVERREYQRYLEDLGDPSFWPDHLASVKLPKPYPKAFEGAVTRMLDAGDIVDGLTVSEIFERARELGLQVDPPDSEMALLPGELTIEGAEK